VGKGLADNSQANKNDQLYFPHSDFIILIASSKRLVSLLLNTKKVNFNHCPLLQQRKKGLVYRERRKRLKRERESLT
jgi:hypothetical protein